MILTTPKNATGIKKTNGFTLKKIFSNSKFFCAIILCATVLMSACVSNESSQKDSQSSAALSFNAKWIPGNNDFDPLDLTTCEEISSVSARIFVNDATSQLLKSGGPWSCDAGQGEMLDVPSGYSAYATVYGREINGYIQYIGNSSPFDLVANETANAGVVNAVSFSPVLISPVNNHIVYEESLQLEWNDPTGHAVAYHLQIATGSQFQPDEIVIDVPTVNGNSYSPDLSLLQVSTPYYWRVFALEKLGDSSTPSAVRGFSLETIPPTSINARFAWETTLSGIDWISPLIMDQSDTILYDYDDHPSLTISDGQGSVESLPESGPLKLILYGKQGIHDGNAFSMRGESVYHNPQSTIDFGLIEMINFIPTMNLPLDGESYIQREAITFEWELLPFAASYEVVFFAPSEDPSGYEEINFIPVENEPDSDPANYLATYAHYAGDNYWAVRAVDLEGAKSMWGPIRRFYVEPFYSPELNHSSPNEISPL